MPQALRRISRPAVSISVIATMLSGCAIPPSGTPGSSSSWSNPLSLVSNDDPCSHKSRNIGIVAGAIGGAVLGRLIGDDKRGALIGAGIGAVAGGFIGADMDRKRCELAELAKRHQLDLQLAAITNTGDDIRLASTQSTPKDAIGLSVSITDKEASGGHFEPGSDRLTEQAKQYFAELARIYQPEQAGEDVADPAARAQAIGGARRKKLLLIGHTDDTGRSNLNAALSERRARSVAQYLKTHGIPESMLFFQGAGEAYPIADNRTEQGRAQNRRVEIVELADEVQFKKYLESRTPHYEFYRPVESAETTAPDTRGATHSKAGKTASAISKPSKAVKPPALAATRIATAKPAAGADAKPAQAASQPAQIDFGGAPVTRASAGLDIGSPVHVAAGSDLISKAWADDTPVVKNCSSDRPRVAGQVKALSNGQAYATADYLPGLYNTSWANMINGHLIALNKVAVLRQGGQAAHPPELLVYPNYRNDSNAKAALRLIPEVNTYKGSKGLLYRLFIRQNKTLQCMDLLLPYGPPFVAKGGYVYQTKSGGLYRAEFTPKMAKS